LGAVRLTVFEKSNPKVKRCLIFKQKIGEVKAAKSVIFFWQNQSLIGIFYNCDESFCAWLTEITHSGNFQKGAIYVRDFQGSCDTTLNWIFILFIISSLIMTQIFHLFVDFDILWKGDLFVLFFSSKKIIFAIFMNYYFLYISHLPFG